MDGTTTRLGVSGNVVPADAALSYPQFVAQEKPPPSYEESQQHVPFRGDSSDVSQADKIAIYRHPLFPLLAMLFDKCELATSSNEGVSSQAFQNDIRTFLLHLGQDGKSLVSGNEETDNLMVKAILVLKIHLLEIEKVNELCKDFCQRYIACLKGKLQTENMLRGIYTSGIEDFPGNVQTDPTLQLNQVHDISSLAFLSQNPSMTSTSSIASPMASHEIKTFAEHVVPIVNPSQVLEQPSLNVHENNDTVGVVNTTSTSNPLMDPQFTSSVSGECTSTSHQSLITTAESLSGNLPRKQAKRGVLPKQATNIMKAWLFQHIAHPYPSEEEKRIIANQTNLTLLQVNNWFINARRRILQPMLDASNSDVMVKARKPKTIQSRSAQRFWPESLVQTIQGSPSTIQFPAQTIHLIPGDLKGSLQTIPLIATSTVLPSTEIRIESVESRSTDKLGTVVATVACPTSQSVNNPNLLTMVTHDQVMTSKGSPVTLGTAQLNGEVDCANDNLPSGSELHITTSQVTRTFP